MRRERLCVSGSRGPHPRCEVARPFRVVGQQLDGLEIGTTLQRGLGSFSRAEARFEQQRRAGPQPVAGLARDLRVRSRWFARRREQRG